MQLQQRFFSQPFGSRLMYVTTLLPIAGFLSLVWVISSNAPTGDDIVDALLLICRYITTESWTEKFSAIFWQYQQHNQVFMRLTYLASYLLTGEINFHLLILIGNIFKCGVLFLLAKSFSRHHFPLYCLPVASLMFFSFYHYEEIFWAACVVGYSGTLLLACCCLYFLEQHKPRVFLALACYWLAAYTMVSSYLLLPIGGAILLYKHFCGEHQHTRAHLLAWLLGGTACIVVRMLTVNIFSTDLYGGKPLSADIWHIERSALEFLASLGATPFFPGSHRAEKIALGAVIFSAYLALLFKRKLFETPFVSGVGIFCSGFLLLVSIFRVGGSDASGYQIYTVTNQAVLLTLLARQLKPHWFTALSLLLTATLFNLNALHHNLPILQQSQLDRDKQFTEDLHTLDNPQGVKWDRGLVLEAMRIDVYRPLEHSHHLPYTTSITQIDHCNDLPLTEKTSFIAKTTERSYIVAVNTLDTNIDTTQETARPATVQLCGTRNYEIRISHGYDLLASMRPANTPWLLLDKRDFAAGDYDLVWTEGDQRFVQRTAIHLAPADRKDFYAIYCKKTRKIIKAFSAVTDYFCSRVPEDEKDTYSGGTGKP